MEDIRNTTSEIEDLVTLLLTQKESLEERKEVDPSKGSINKTLLAIKQLSKKLEAILDNERLRTTEELKTEVCEKRIIDFRANRKIRIIDSSDLHILRNETDEF